MEFIFMLTRQDRTVPEAARVLAEIAPLGLRHIGFKDVGADVETLRNLAGRIRAAGATSYLEVVATSAAAALASARIAVEIGVDRLLGGTEVAETLEILRGSGIAYYPFPGRPQGHPTRLAGSAEEIGADTARYRAMGCAGVDLLAYRAVEAEPLALVRAARAALPDGQLICAGDVNSKARIAALREAGCDAFTIGSAIFDGTLAPQLSLSGRLAEILAL